MIFQRFFSMLLCALLWVAPSTYAALELELTQGIDSALPIVVAAFEGENSQLKQRITPIIANDLKNSGRFQVMRESKITTDAEPIDYAYWREQGVDYLLVGQIQALNLEPLSQHSPKQWRVSFQLLDVLGKRKELLSKTYTIHDEQFRAFAHHISDEIYQQLTGHRGIFSTRIAYVVANRENDKPLFTLEVADFDGANPKPLLVTPEPIMSPKWSPDGKRIVYVSFENKRAQIFSTDVATGKRRLISTFEGINGAPVWSPDSRFLALVLSKSGKPKIYLLDQQSNRLTQLTHGLSIDTEPNWSPDGKRLLFTSDRGGSPQIYELNMASKAIKRLTFQGRYNSTASYTPDEKQLVLLHRDGNSRNFKVAVHDITRQYLQELSDIGNAESPSVSPNGKMVIYTHYRLGERILALSSLDGKVKLRLPTRKGDVQEPAWSPFLMNYK